MDLGGLPPNLLHEAIDLVGHEVIPALNGADAAGELSA